MNQWVPYLLMQENIDVPANGGAHERVLCRLNRKLISELRDSLVSGLVGMCYLTSFYLRKRIRSSCHQ